MARKRFFVVASALIIVASTTLVVELFEFRNYEVLLDAESLALTSLEPPESSLQQTSEESPGAKLIVSSHNNIPPEPGNPIDSSSSPASVAPQALHEPSEKMLWKRFISVIGCQPEIEFPPLMSSQAIVSKVFKKSECHVSNMQEPPFYNNSDITNRLVIDVGANSGKDYTGPGAKKGHLVYAFEPFKDPGDEFIANMRDFGFTVDNGGLTIVDVFPGEKAIVPKGLLKRVQETKRGHVVLFKAAAGAKTSQIEVPIYAYNTINTLIKNNAGESVGFSAPLGTERIAVVKLDDIIAHEDHIFLFKIDAQGYEPNVIEGATRILSEDPPDILTFEFWPKGIDGGIGQDSKEMLQDLWEKSYHCFDWSQNMHIPDERPDEVPGFVRSFYDNEKSPFPGSECTTEKCRSFGLWDELVCARLKEE